MQLIPLVDVTQDFKVPSVDGTLTRSILESKRPSMGEIELTLFEHCNIVCDFCFHDKDSRVGMTLPEMMSKLPIIEQQVQKLAGRVKFVQFNMVGGELFQDPLIQSGMLDQYRGLMLMIRDICERYNLPMQTVWVTNLLFAEVDKVADFITELNNLNIPSQIIASYDLSGRPISNRYKTNLVKLSNLISTINLVATSESIQTLLEGSDPYFDFLYNTYTCYFDDFIPDAGADALIPSDSLLLKFYKHVHDHYPKIVPICEWIENDRNEMHCLSLNKLTIFPDNKTSNCRWHRYDQSMFGTQFDIHDNTGMMQNFMDTNGCLECKYFAKCGFRCYTQWDWKGRIKDVNGCVMREFFDYVAESAN